MSRTVRLLALMAAALAGTNVARAGDDEVSLFNSKGKAAAYIVVDDDMTIYLWSGKPVAYLEPDKRAGGFDVYGFNGKHLGWFVQGAIWNHDGDPACALKERLKSTDYEPYKSYKEYKPYKAYKEYAPYRPSFSKSFGEVPCSLFLSEGKE
jgi:hypothetical protein